MLLVATVLVSAPAMSRRRTSLAVRVFAWRLAGVAGPVTVRHGGPGRLKAGDPRFKSGRVSAGGLQMKIEQRQRLREQRLTSKALVAVGTRGAPPFVRQRDGSL